MSIRYLHRFESSEPSTNVHEYPANICGGQPAGKNDWEYQHILRSYKAKRFRCNFIKSCPDLSQELEGTIGDCLLYKNWNEESGCCDHKTCHFDQDQWSDFQFWIWLKLPRLGSANSLQPGRIVDFYPNHSLHRVHVILCRWTTHMLMTSVFRPQSERARANWRRTPIMIEWSYRDIEPMQSYLGRDWKQLVQRAWTCSESCFKGSSSSTSAKGSMSEARIQLSTCQSSHRYIRYIDLSGQYYWYWAWSWTVCEK